MTEVCVRITEFTDPGCPWAWSAEPARARIDYLYGERIEWRVRLVGLRDESLTPEKGYDADEMAERQREIARDHGMPIDTRPRPYLAATVPACRAVVATKAHRPECTRRILRQLRVRNWRGEQLDDLSTLHGAAADAGISVEEIDAWTADPEVEERLARDMELARQPLPAARALDHKLANWSGGMRYTCPSYELERLEDGVRIAIPGFQPFAAYDIVLANLVPGMDRRDPPSTAHEVLAWSGIPMATREVASVLDRDDYDVREELAREAHIEPVGADGFWTL
jgi:predicted DsbA family dithiol-disulfide isomerase